MDLLREHLMYKDVPTHICMAKLNRHEQYEILRLVMATRTKNVTICEEGIINDYLRNVRNRLAIEGKRCC